MQTGVMSGRVHNSHCRCFFVEWILRCADFFSRIIEVRKMKWRFEYFAARVGVKEKRSKLVAEPERAVSGALHRFDIEVGARQDALVRKLLRDRERNSLIRIAQLEEIQHGDRTCAAHLRLEVGADVIDAKMKIGGILERTEAVIAHDIEGSIPVVQNGGKTLYWLLVQERDRLAINGVRSQLLTGSWPLRKSRGRKNGATFQLISSTHGEHAESGDKQA